MKFLNKIRNKINYPVTTKKFSDKTQISPKDKNIFYVHIAKTGGTSINHIISSNYKTDDSENHIERYVNKNDLKKINKLKNKKFLSGHIKYKVAKSIFGNKYYYITCFRNPIEHMISHLCWVKRLHLPEYKNRFDKANKNIQELSLALKEVDFKNTEQLNRFLSNLNKTGRGLFDNCQTRYFLNNNITNRLINNEDFVSAMANINNMDYMMLLEDLDRGIDNLIKIMDWNNKAVISRKNATKKFFGIDKNNKEILKLILSFNKYDILLYRNIKKIYAKQLKIHNRII